MVVFPKLRWWILGGILGVLFGSLVRMSKVAGLVIKLFDKLPKRPSDPYVVYENPDELGYFAARASTMFDGVDTYEDLMRRIDGE